MSCTVDIRLELFQGSDGGGTLSYLGYSNTEGGSPGAGGSTIPTITGDTLLLDPSGFIPGFYHFQYEGGPSGCSDTQIQKLQVTPEVSAGTPTDPTFCVADTNIEDLHNYLTGEDLGGDWNVNPASEGTDIDGALTGSDLDLSQVTTPGTYYVDYQIDQINVATGYDQKECVDCFSKSTIEITIIAVSEAGTATDITTCASCGFLNLFDFLSGADPNGSWNNISGPVSTDPTGYQGSINITTAGTYVYEYSVGSGNCADSEQITVEVLTAPDAGTGSAIDRCSDDSIIVLADHLTGADSGGFWTISGSSPQNGTVDLINGTYTPDLGDDGTFTFVYNVVQPGVIEDCSAGCQDTSNVVVNMGDTGYAGVNIGLSGCINDAWDLKQELDNASPQNTTTGEFWFLGYSSGCDSNLVSGDFVGNGTSQTWPPMTNFGSALSISALSGSGCYQFMHYTPNEGASCQDMAFIEITISSCCTLDYTLNYYSSPNELCVESLVNCGDCGCNPDLTWYYSQNGTNFTEITGTSGNCVNLNQGTGTYKSVVTCGSCTVEKYYYHDSPNTCSISVNVTESGGILTANPTGCSGTVTYQWSYSVDGLGNWINLGQSQTQATSQGDGFYRVQANCPDDQGCFDVEIFEYDTGCTLSASVSESNGTLTASQTGGTAPITYQWYYSPTGDAGSYTAISGATSSTYTPIQSGWFLVEIEDTNGCSDTAEIQFTLPSCNIEVTLAELGNGDLEATITGNTVTPSIRWQYSATGTGWNSLPQFDDQTTITPDQGSGHYRVLVWDGAVGSSCSDSDTIEWTSGCSGGVTITQDTCGPTDVDIVGILDISSSINSSEYAEMKSNWDATVDALDADPNINPRFMVVQYYTDLVSDPACPNPPAQHAEHKALEVVNWTTSASTAKNFTRQTSGLTDFFNESLGQLYDEFQAGNLSFRAGAAAHLAVFTDAERGNINTWLVNQEMEHLDCNDNTRVEETPLFQYADNFKSTYSTVISVVRYRNGNNSTADAAAASIASQGGSYTGTVESGAPTPRRLYQLTFGQAVPNLPYDIACVELNSSITGCSGTPVRTWQYRPDAGSNWTDLAPSGPTIEVNDPGDYRLLVSCSNCNYTSNIISI